MNAEGPLDDPSQDGLWRLQTKDKDLRRLIVAFEALPVTAQLQYVSNLILDRMERDEPMDPQLTAAFDILEMVRKRIDQVPNFDQMVPI